MIVILAGLALFPANTDKAEAAARAWVNKYLPGVTLTVQPTCEEWDTDDNGMVRCNLTYSDAAGVKPLTLECPSAWMLQWTSECHDVRR